MCLLMTIDEIDNRYTAAEEKYKAAVMEWQPDDILSPLQDDKVEWLAFYDAKVAGITKCWCYKCTKLAVAPMMPSVDGIIKMLKAGKGFRCFKGKTAQRDLTHLIVRLKTCNGVYKHEIGNLRRYCAVQIGFDKYDFPLLDGDLSKITLADSFEPPEFR